MKEMPMPELNLTGRELEILEFVLSDLAEAIDDGDRPEFTPGEVERLRNKVQEASGKSEPAS
jgi:hypothetical protein